MEVMSTEDENDKEEIKIGEYQTKYFHVCPGASSLYGNIESKGVDMDMAERSARLQDALFFVEEHIQRDGYKPERDYVMVAKNLAKNIMKMAEMMGLEKEHNYIQGHVDTIIKTVEGKKLEERVIELTEKNVPTNPSKWSYYKSQAKKKFDVYPSAYANAWAAKQYKAAGGGWRTTKESVSEALSVTDERHFGKKGIIIMIDDNGKKVSAIFKNKKNADKYNRNKASDLQALLKLAKNTPYPKAIDEKKNIDEAIKGRNNRTGESFGMVVGSDKPNNDDTENGFEVVVRKQYSSRISSYKFTFDSNGEVISVLDYGYSMDGSFPDMKGSGSAKTVQPTKRNSIKSIGDITTPAFAKKIYLHVQKELKKSKSQNRTLAMSEATRGEIHKAAKKGNYPATIVVSEKGKVIYQELVKTPQLVPAIFMILQKKYPNAKISVESKSGETLFTEAMDKGKKLKIYNKLKKGDNITIKYGSSIRKDNEKEFVVTKGKTKVGKAQVERIILKNIKNPKGVKYYLYNRDGNVSMAIGDMAATIEDMYESVSEGMVEPRRGHNYYQLTKDTPIKYISGHSGIGLEVPGVLLHNEYGTFKGKKGAYIIDYFGRHFYVDIKNKFASDIANPRSSEQTKGLMKNVKVIDKAPEFSDWKKYMKESVNEGKSHAIRDDKGRPFLLIVGEEPKDSKGKSEYKKNGFYISPQKGFKGLITAYFKDDKTLKKNIDKKYHKQLGESVINELTIGKMAKKYKNRDRFISAFFAHMKKHYGDSFKDFEKDKKYRETIGKAWDREHGVNEYFVENYDDTKQFVEFIKENKTISEAEYQGRKVELNKIMQGDVKKFKVYVKNPKGNVVKVNFGHKGKGGEKTMSIKKNNPERRKSFRARHNCDNPGPKHKARYWSCRKW